MGIEPTAYGLKDRHSAIELHALATATRGTGIEPVLTTLEAVVLPLNYPPLR